MRPGEWTLRSRRVVTPTGTRALDVLIRGEVIEALATFEDPDREGVVLDVGSHVVLPGLVDLHAHVQESDPEGAEGFETATRAAAAGGITTLADLPVHDRPATANPGALAAKLASSVGKLWVDCGFHGGLILGGAGEAGPLVDAGVLAIVATPGPGPVGFPAADAADLRRAMPALARLGRPLLLALDSPSGSGSAGREVEAIRGLIGLCREHRCRAHVLGLSDADALPAIAEARAEGLPLTVETCPHHLAFAAETPGDGRLRSGPPARGAPNRDRLWEGLRSGLIGAIGSGHLPSPPGSGRPGVASLQVAMPAVWTEARGRGFTPDDLARWMAGRPAEVVGLAGRKGSIAPGSDADFVVFDPDATFRVDPNHLFHRLPDTPYEGRTLAGVVELTILRGQVVHESGRFHGEPRGVPILRLDETIPLPGGLDHLNKATEAEALGAFLRCCGSARWARRMAALRPFAEESDLLEASDRAWAELDQDDRLEAFLPRPGRGRLGPAETTTDTDWPGVREDLGRAGLIYEAKFGHPFLVADPGLPDRDRLDSLRRRLGNDPEVEDQLASADQAEINRRALRSLIARLGADPSLDSSRIV